jgi:hypothetical protein
MAGAGDVDRREVAGPDRAVQVRIDEVQARGCAEVAEQPWLDVFGFERAPQKRIVEQVDLADGQVVGGAPVGIEQAELVRRERLRDCAQRRPFSKITSTLSCS